MFKVPVFTSQNYQSIMSKKYSELDKSDRQDIGQILNFCKDNFDKYADLDTRQLTDNNDKNLIRAKLLIPTGRNCNYFSRNRSGGEHFGLDIILPAETPVVARESWVANKIKLRDWQMKNEWNSITIKGSDCFRSYEHCHTIDVQTGQYVTKWQIIWTIGKTWNATQYHIHLQCDLLNAPFVPYRSDDIQNIPLYTKDPLPAIAQISHENTIFQDMPWSTDYSQPIMELYNMWIVKWNGQKIFPDDFLQRYELAIMIDRLLSQKPELIKKLSDLGNSKIDYIDIAMYGPELMDALVILKKYNIMMWYNNQFLPDKKVKWQELLAVCGRLFFGLKDKTSSIRYSLYADYFTAQNIIPKDRHYIWEPIPRKEVFRILSNCIWR